ncbi:MAG: hypothetical protein ACAI44_22700 [Candidatus Sericytochromatia bacterium]
MSIRGLGNSNNRFDISSAKKAGSSASAGKAGGAAAAGAAAGVAAAGASSKNEDVLRLSAVAGQAGDAPQVNLSAAGPLAKTVHTDALAKASKQLSPEARSEAAIKLIADNLVERMFGNVA